DYFVPTKTSDEWDAFTANLPQGVSLTDCCPAGYHDMDGDGYGAGDPCPDGTYAIVDNNSDCSDSDATSFPGNTGTNLLCNYSTPCAGFYRGSGLDHNCDGASTKALWQDANVAPYTSSNNLPTTLYYVSSSGAYIAVDAASGACGTVWNNTVGSWAGAGSWYIAGTGGYSVAFFGGAEVLCK
ncbi:hypothetical protein JW977_04895, partial [Candidatus Falkowbacteria bacterium]|nr:hypothetical protein [Candidatus Falkowbacteria bacterium]